MGLLRADDSLVLVIDMQGRMLELCHRHEVAIEGTRRLLQLAELFRLPVVMSEQYPEGLGPTETSLLETFDSLETPKRRIGKTRFSCCGASGFEQAFEELLSDVDAANRQIVVAGIEAHICVVQTVVDLLERNCEVFVCWDCVTGRGAEYRRWGFERMQQAGARITNHESVAFEWARDKGDPRFRSINQLFRGGQIGGGET